MVQHKIKYMKYVLVSIAIYFTLFLALTSPPLFSVFNAGIEVLIILLVIASIELNPYYVILVFFITGYIMDAYLFTAPGAHAVFFLLIINLIIFTRNIIYKNSFILRVSYIFFAVLVFNTFRLIFVVDAVNAHLCIQYLLLSPFVTVLSYLMLRLLRILISSNYGLGKK